VAESAETFDRLTAAEWSIVYYCAVLIIIIDNVSVTCSTNRTTSSADHHNVRGATLVFIYILTYSEPRHITVVDRKT